MKHIKVSAIAAIASILFVCCTKETIQVPQPEDVLQEAYSTFGVNLRFDAPDVSETTIYFYDADGVQIGMDNIVVPATTSETVSSVFLSETTPEYVYTPGLVNTGENGLLSIPSSTVQTKGGDDSLLLIIRR